MRLALVLAATAATALVATHASAADRYFNVSAGGLDKSDYSYGLTSTASARVDLKAGSEFSATYGLKLTPQTRVEFGLSTRSQDVDSYKITNGTTTTAGASTGKSSAYSLDANYFYDFPVKGKIVPYVGGGLGIASVKLHDALLNNSTSVLKAQLMAGVDFAVTAKINLYVEARAERIGTLTVKATSGSSTQSTDFTLDNTAIVAGLRTAF